MFGTYLYLSLSSGDGVLFGYDIDGQAISFVCYRILILASVLSCLYVVTGQLCVMYCELFFSVVHSAAFGLINQM